MSVVQAYTEKGNGPVPTSLLKLSGIPSQAHRFEPCWENSDLLFPSMAASTTEKILL